MPRQGRTLLGVSSHPLWNSYVPRGNLTMKEKKEREREKREREKERRINLQREKRGTNRNRNRERELETEAPTLFGTPVCPELPPDKQKKNK